MTAGSEAVSSSPTATAPPTVASQAAENNRSPAAPRVMPAAER